LLKSKNNINTEGQARTCPSVYAIFIEKRKGDLNMEEYKEGIKRLYIILGKQAEAENQKNIEELYRERKITYAQKDHLTKFNRMLAK